MQTTKERRPRIQSSRGHGHFSDFQLSLELVKRAIIAGDEHAASHPDYRAHRERLLMARLITQEQIDAAINEGNS